MKLWALYVCALGLISACASQCGTDDTLAELSQLSGGAVDRDHAQHEGAWEAAKLGDSFRIGDGLRTGARSTALLALHPSGQARVAPHTLLRFLDTPPAQTSRNLSVETGTLEIVARQMDVEIHTPRAVTRIAPGSAVRLSASAGGERFDLVVGRVWVAHAGVSEALEPERPLVLGNSDTEPVTDARAVAQQTPAPDASAADHATRDAAAEPNDDGLNVAGTGGPFDVLLATLEDATLHAAAPPLSVRVPTPRECGAEATLSVDGSSARVGPDGALLKLSAGNHSVRFSCAGRAAVAARLRVRRDSATQDLPKRAPSVRVEADGRHYAIQYQNTLPVVAFAWPTKRSDGAFRLVVQKGEAQRVYELDRPEHALASGALSEGEYTFWFRDGTGRTSPPTRLRLSFDNTARSAYLSAPAEDSVATPSGIDVTGAALRRSRVSVQGTPVPLDGKGRFHAETQLLPGQTGVFVRVDHPESGVHYYLRRLRRPPPGGDSGGDAQRKL